MEFNNGGKRKRGNRQKMETYGQKKSYMRKRVEFEQQKVKNLRKEDGNWG